jgi:hypothetical protein
VAIQALLRDTRAVMEDLPPHQQKELVGDVVRRAVVSPERLVFDMLGGVSGWPKSMSPLPS